MNDETRAALGGALSLAAGLGIGRFVYTPLLPMMLGEGTLTTTAAGFVASVHYTGYLLGAVALIFTGARLGGRGVLLATLLVNAVAVAGVAASSSLVWIASMRFISGVAGAAVLVLASRLVIYAAAAERRDLAASLMFAGVGAGIVLSSLLVSGGRTAGWPADAVWIGCGVLSLVLSLVAWRFLPPRAEMQTRHLRSAPTGRASDLGLLALAYGCVGFGYVITATFLVAIVAGAPETRQWQGFVWVAFGLVAAPSALVWNWLSLRSGRLRAYAVASLLASLGISLCLVVDAGTAAILATVSVGGTFIGLSVLGLSASLLVPHGAIANPIALMTAAFGLGQIIGPAAAGWIADKTGHFGPALGAAAICLLVSAALALVVDRRQNVGSKARVLAGH